MKDPFERVSVDLESALSELTAATRARLDDIGPRQDALRPVVSRATRTARTVVTAPPAPPAQALSAARLPTTPPEPEPEAQPQRSEPAPTAVPSRSATPHSPSSVGFYSTVRLRPRVASRPSRVGLPPAPPADDVVAAATSVPETSAVVAEDALVESPVSEEVFAETPVVQDPAVEEPVVEEPVVEEPVVEEPAASEEPVAFEEPVVEEPAAVDEPVVAARDAGEVPAHGPASIPRPVPEYAVAPRLLGRDRPLRPVAAPPHPGRRRALMAAGGVAAAIVVLVAGFLASGPLRDDATRRAVAPAALPAAPGVAPSPGRLTDVTIRADGSAQVTEWLTLDRSARSVRILPAAGRRARVSDAVVDGAGRARIGLGGSAAPQVVTFDAGVKRVVVRYTVSDAATLSAQDRDRALLDLPLLGMSAPRGALRGPRVVRVQDGRVLGAACGASKSTATPCGVQRDDGWRTGKAATKRSAVLLASVDLGR